MAINAFFISLQSGAPTLIWGPPGVGKTSIIEAGMERVGRPVETLIGSIMEPQDVGGLLIKVGDRVQQAPPAWAVRLGENPGCLFWDELTTSAPAVQAAGLRIIFSLKVGAHPLHPSTWIAAAANPPEQAAGGYDLAAPMANRFAHFDFHLDPAVWASGMLGGFPDPVFPILPKDWRQGLPTSRSLVSAFIRTRPELLLKVPDSESEAGRAWPSPRSWDNVSRLLTAAASVGADEDTRAELVGACVGQGPALEFQTYVEQLDLPDPEELLAEPGKFKLPGRGDQQYAVLGSVVGAFLRQATPERWTAAWTIMAGAADQGAPDVAAANVQTLAQARTPEMPLPEKQIQSFIPLLREAGLLKGGK